MVMVAVSLSEEDVRWIKKNGFSASKLIQIKIKETRENFDRNKRV